MRFLIPLFLLINFTYAQTNIVVSILPQKTFVEKIGGEKVSVTNMVRPGSDPHSYEPKPSQMKEIAKADIYFPIGLEFENTWLTKFADQNKNMKFVEMTKNVEYIEMAKHSHHHHHDEGHDSHEEGHHESELPYEWAGVFELQKGTYTWSFSKVEGNYADPRMKMLIIKANKKDDDLIEAYEEQAKNVFANNKTKTATNNSSLETNNSFYTLSFDESKNKTIFKVQIKQAGKYLFFTEHMPIEFEANEHYFKDSTKKDIEVLTSVPEEAHHGKDPHVWVSPKNVKIMAKNIYNTLVEVDSKNQEYYKTNYDNFIKEIGLTDIRIKSILSSLPRNSKFMVFHPSWGYFAKDYNLEQLVIEVEGKEPKPKILQKIIKEAKEENVKAIFTQTEFSDKSAKVIADELKIKVIKETPLAQNWSQNLIQMANSIANNK
ncbi:metal ABC transporter solute-binding protein, Zn/Mn family [Poseidonibacter lekithochrous]|uniref:metal ABC transporter solute-binding protein, Zn/Mn family n=1 Tax=Poseidonibacter lekithochrous TaxID=1904463 RepID=UPI000D360061|nr:zinc ABC transporter substrate-binding protein [Poseidonibacter lekithochrous]